MDYSTSLRIVVNVAPCPPGFYISTDTHKCECYSTVSSVAKCNASTGTVTREGNMWLAYDKQDNCTILHTGCPFDYCKTDSVTYSLSNPDAQCSYNRAGRLCGGCQDGYSLILGSNKCQKCSHMQYTLVLIIPFAIVGIALVALLIAANLTLAVGLCNGIVLYANIVKLCEPIFFPHGPIPVVSEVNAWINMDFGISTCFLNEMNSCSKMWLQFCFPLYLWILILAIIVACHYSFKVTRIVGNNAIPVLATLLLLSYTKLLRTVILILSLTRVSCNDSTTLYWLVDPNIPYLGSCHLPLFIMAVLVLSLFIVPYTFFLLFFPLLETSYRHKWRCLQKSYNKLKPFIDAYGGPYKDNFHYWTGVVVLLRIVLALTTALMDSLFITGNVLVILLAALLFFQCLFDVYKKRTNHIFTVWFIISLIISVKGTILYMTQVVVMGCNTALWFIIIVHHVYQYQIKKRLTKWYNERNYTIDSYVEEREPLLG